jgi:hypothetical protein
MSDFTSQIILSVLGGIFFIVSESLPFIKNIKSNGIIHLMYNFLQMQNSTFSENEALLNVLSVSQSNNTNDTIITFENSVSENINKLNLNLISTNSILTNSTLELINNSKQLKLQTSELYELNYIINYIKVNYPKKIFKTKFLTKSNKHLLISQGYIIDYDSEQDTYMIKW